MLKNIFKINADKIKVEQLIEKCAKKEKYRTKIGKIGIKYDLI